MKVFSVLGTLDLKFDAVFDIAQRDAGNQIAKSRVFDFADPLDYVAGLQIGLPRRAAGDNAAHDARHFFYAQTVGDRGHHERENHIHDHAGRDDGHPLRHALRHVAARIVRLVRIGYRLGRQIAVRQCRGVVEHWPPIDAPPAPTVCNFARRVSSAIRAGLSSCPSIFT